jgi:phosphoribosylaminoimidazole-succinocarboxamide synthase
MLTADRFVRSGKVRDLYRLADQRIVLVASDRISAFDVVLPNDIPDKGRVLTGLSRFWFAETESIVPNHLLETDVAAIPADGFDTLRGRVMVCRPAAVIPIEAVVRGYLSGSGWKEYREHGTVCGIPLPAGLQESDRLPAPIFTPASKAPAGHHDENLSFDAAIDYVDQHLLDHGSLGRDVAAELVESVREAAMRLYRYGAAVAERSGLLLADTKFEFGIPLTSRTEVPGPPEERLPDWHGPATGFSLEPGAAGGQVMLIDEVMTPDSSRFWDAAAYAPGGPQPSFDKQFVRDWLERQPWDKTAPGPELPPDVVAGTRARYVEAFERITSASFERYLRADVIGP